ncbi:MAG: hypothetical protein LH474_07820 [Chamaesiphon sp.]|nr:hypothetical protein [Chamaesiphon sp.]
MDRQSEIDAPMDKTVELEELIEPSISLELFHRSNIPQRDVGTSQLPPTSTYK